VTVHGQEMSPTNYAICQAGMPRTNGGSGEGEISRDMVRKVPREMQKKDLPECLGRGPGALWQRKGITLKRG
jgi:hypothetical protein